jgi:hypothetical protein
MAANTLKLDREEFLRLAAEIWDDLERQHSQVAGN